MIGAPSAGGIGSRLKAKAGPLPVWAWSIGIVGLGLLALMLRPKPREGDQTADTGSGPLDTSQQVQVEPPAVVRNGVSGTPAPTPPSSDPGNGGGGSGTGGDMSTPPPDVHLCNPMHPELEGCSSGSSGPPPSGTRPPMPRCPQGGVAHWDGHKWICPPPGPTYDSGHS